MSGGRVLKIVVEVFIKLLLVALVGSACGRMIDSWGYSVASILIGITVQAIYYFGCLHLETKLK